MRPITEDDIREIHGPDVEVTVEITRSPRAVSPGRPPRKFSLAAGVFAASTIPVIIIAALVLLGVGYIALVILGAALGAMWTDVFGH